MTTELPEEIQIPDSLLRGSITPGMVIVAEPDSAGKLHAVDVASEDIAHELGKRIAHSGGSAYLAQAEIAIFKAYRPREEIRNRDL